MLRVLRGCRATVAAFVLGGLGPAHAANLVWQFNQDEESAFLGVVDSAAKADNETYPFYMSCAATGDETTVISNVDAKALGAAIAKGDVPAVSYLLDGQPGGPARRQWHPAQTGDVSAFGEMPFAEHR